MRKRRGQGRKEKEVRERRGRKQDRGIKTRSGMVKNVNL